MIRRFILLCLLPCAFLFLGASCTNQQNSTAKLPGSIFRSPDDGGTWASKSFLTDQKGQKVHLAQTEITKLLISPKNSQTLFMGTRQNGLFVSDSAGDNWKQLFSTIFQNFFDTFFHFLHFSNSSFHPSANRKTNQK